MNHVVEILYLLQIKLVVGKSKVSIKRRVTFYLHFQVVSASAKAVKQVTKQRQKICVREGQMIQCRKTIEKEEGISHQSEAQ